MTRDLSNFIVIKTHPGESNTQFVFPCGYSFKKFTISILISIRDTVYFKDMINGAVNLFQRTGV